MTTGPSTSAEAAEQFFEIHLLNTYNSIMFPVIAEEFNLTSDVIQTFALGMHKSVDEQLAAKGIQYSTLRNALTPQRGRNEVAFVFDSKQAGDDYGYEISKLWLPTLRQHGPAKTSIKHGDMMGLPSEIVWQSLENLMVGAKNFPRMSPEMYYIVYFTNLSDGQLNQMDRLLNTKTKTYLGYIDCSTWNILKVAMPLLQFGLRIEDVILVAEQEGSAKHPGFPVEDHGFDIFGIEEMLYDALLTFRLDQGVPEWAADDASMSLNLLGGRQELFEDMKIHIDESRIEYLEARHPQSYQGAGLSGLRPEAVSAAIKQKIKSGMIYNIRYIEGSRNGVPVPELNAHMFTLQVDFPDTSGKTRRYHIGMKYHTKTHVCEVVTII